MCQQHNLKASSVKEYAQGVFRILREHDYNPRAMTLYVVGGGGCLIRNFADYGKKRVTFNDDIWAMGYEQLAKLSLEKRDCYVS